MFEIRHYVTKSGKDVFEALLSRLADVRAQAKISVRIDRLALGNFGDCKSLRQGLFEMRIDFGPGYRVYLRHDRKGARATAVRWRQTHASFRHRPCAAIPAGL